MNVHVFWRLCENTDVEEARIEGKASNFFVKENIINKSGTLEQWCLRIQWTEKPRSRLFTKFAIMAPHWTEAISCEKKKKNGKKEETVTMEEGKELLSIDLNSNLTLRNLFHILGV